MMMPGIRSMHRIMQRLRQRGVPLVLVLMYHRVADIDPDPWNLCVSPKHFAEHLEVLRTFGTTLTLQQLVQALERGSLPRRATVITFDDGYADNLYQAKPLLEHYALPATFFLTVGQLGSNREFWWDELARLILNQDLPLMNEYRTSIAGTSGEVEDARYPMSIEQRHQRYYSLWEQLYVLPGSEKRSVMDAMWAKLGVDPETRLSHRILSEEEVGELAVGDLIEIGAHTMSHPPLALLPVSAQLDEIQQSKNRLEQLLNDPIESFAYPHGHFSEATVTLVRKAGFRCACSTVAAPVSRADDRFALPRVHMPNSDGETLDRWLHAWQRTEA